jgi:hypothetical protein
LANNELLRKIVNKKSREYLLTSLDPNAPMHDTTALAPFTSVFHAAESNTSAVRIIIGNDRFNPK